MKAYRTEIKPTPEQCRYLAQAFGNARWAYNEFIGFNQARYRHRKDGYGDYGYCNAYAVAARYSLAKLLHARVEGNVRKATVAQARLLNELLVCACLPAVDLHTLGPDLARLLLDAFTEARQLPRYEPWMDLAHSKSVKQAFGNAGKAYAKLFASRKTGKTTKGRKGKTLAGPRFKKKNRSKDSIYLVEHIRVERHRIKMPGMGWVRLKECGYIPIGTDTVSSVTVSRVAGRYYVSCTPKRNTVETHEPRHDGKIDGLGIDLGIKNLAAMSDGTLIDNPNRCKELRRLSRKLKRQQRALARKLERITVRTCHEEGKDKGKVKHVNYKRPLKECRNIAKARLAIQKTWQRITNIRHDHMDKAIAQLVGQEPRFITIEDLNIQGMMRNRHLSRTLAEQELGRFVTHLKAKCAEHGIELRQVDRWYPSSQLCSDCGYRNTAVRDLNIRAWDCPSCGVHHDRDVNAAKNLKAATEYTVIA